MHQKRQTGKIKSAVTAAVFMLIGVFLDQWSKYLAISQLKGRGPIILIDGVFQLSYLENRGAAFGMLQNQTVFFLIATPVILLVVIFFYFRLPPGRRYLPLRICSVLIAAGAVGNMIDRIRLGYVIDFFYFSLIDFPIFNVADIYVTTATIGLLIFVFFYYKEEDFEQVFHRGK